MKTISSKNVIAKVFRDFGVTEAGFVHDAVEWVGEVLERIGTTVMYENRACRYEVKDHKVCIPPSCESIVAIEYNGKRVPLGADQGFMAYRTVGKDSTSETEWLADELLPGNHEPTSRTVTIRYPYESDNNHYYNLNPGYIVTSFESGWVVIYYRKFPVDDKGFPMIWDNVYVREACSWYIMSRILLSGYQHPVIDFGTAREESERFIMLAGNANFPNIERMERFRNMWVRMVPDIDAYSNFFENSEQRGDIFR